MGLGTQGKEIPQAVVDTPGRRHRFRGLATDYPHHDPGDHCEHHRYLDDKRGGGPA